MNTIYFISPYSDRFRETVAASKSINVFTAGKQRLPKGQHKLIAVQKFKTQQENPIMLETDSALAKKVHLKIKKKSKKDPLDCDKSFLSGLLKQFGSPENKKKLSR